MPIYTYKCEDCDHEWDEIAPMDTKEAICPACKGRALRQVTSASVHFKGVWP